MPKRSFRSSAEPNVLAIPLRKRSRGKPVPLLSESDKAAITAISSVVPLAKGALIYRAHSDAESIYNLVQGAVKTISVFPGGVEHVTGFHFPGDIFGLAEQGRYVESAIAVVPSVAHKIPLDALEDLLTRNGGLALRLMQRLVHALRTRQHHAVILSRNDALGKVAMFLQGIERLDLARGPGGSIHFPMTRSDMADYVGLTNEAVSRASTYLDQQGIVSFVDRHHFHIHDAPALEALTSGEVDRGVRAPRKSPRKTAAPKRGK